MGEKVRWESWVEIRTRESALISQIELGQLIPSVANEKLSRGIRNKHKPKTNFPSLLNFTLLLQAFLPPPPQLCRRMGNLVYCSQSITFSLAASYSLHCSSALTWALSTGTAVLLEEIAPAARKRAPVRAPKHRLQLLIGACSCVRSSWAVASIRTSLPAPERGFSTRCRWVCAPLWSSKGRREQLVSPWSSSPGSAQAVEKGCSCPTSQHGLAEPDRVRSDDGQSPPPLPMRASLGCRGQVGPSLGIRRFQRAQTSEGARALAGPGAT